QQGDADVARDLGADQIAASPTGAPKIKSIIIKNVPDPASRRLLLQQGDADVARDLGADQIAASPTGAPK
ncbi:hypothetical protein Q6272_33930, partial [Klebsiella pneumoniae]|nr:hypothetical protein [Klebsiella pneumoniae]